MFNLLSYVICNQCLFLLKANLKERHLFVLTKLLKRNQIGFVSFVLASCFWHTLLITLTSLFEEVSIFSKINLSQVSHTAPDCQMFLITVPRYSDGNRFALMQPEHRTKRHSQGSNLRLYRCVCQHFPCSEITWWLLAPSLPLPHWDLSPYKLKTS